MSNSKKLWLGILTFLPFILVFIYFVLFFTVFLGNIHQLEQTHQNEFPFEIVKSLFTMFIPIFLSIVISLIIMIYYIVHANNNPDNDNGKKIMWTLLLIFVTSIGSLVYYFVEILPTNNKLSNSHIVNE